MLRLRRKRLHSIVAMLAICLLIAALLYVIAINDEGLASLFARACGYVVIALLIMRYLKRERFSKQFFTDLPRETYRRIVISITAATFLLSALVTCLLTLTLHPSSWALWLWITLIFLDMLQIPLGVQTLRDNGLHFKAPWTCWAAIGLSCITLIPTIWIPDGVWNAFFFIPSAVGLTIFPLMMWHLILKTVYDEEPEKGKPLKQLGFLASQAITCLLVFALGLALIAILSGYPFTGQLGQICYTASFATVSFGLALLMSQAFKVITPEEPVGRAPEPEIIIVKESSPADLIETGIPLLVEAFQLTEREEQIIKLIAQGRSRSKIANMLSISEETVNSHAKRSYSKLDIHSKQDLLDLIEKANGK